MDKQLNDRVRDLAKELEVPGVAVGIVYEGHEHCAYHGVTSVENPLAVDEGTLFQFGSTGKTFTSVAILRLVEAGKVDLDAPVRTHIPELRLQDRHVAEHVTILQLLNHTAGWDGDDFSDFGDGDDAIARYVEHMAELRQITPPGAVVAYNNASLTLAGRVIEKVTGLTFEKAMHDLVLEPVGLRMTFYFANDVMTRRFAVGHRREPDGTVRVLRPWAMPRTGNPMGGMSATASDQVRWARFHLDRGRTPDGTQLIAAELIERMQRPTASCPGSAHGDAVGISWLLSEIDGEPVVAHGGATLGQRSAFVMVPGRSFALVSLTNCEPNGPLFNRRLRDWAFEAYLGLKESDPVPQPRPAEALAEYAGTYETVAERMRVTVDGDHLSMDVEPKPEIIAQLGPDADDSEPASPLHMMPNGDRWAIFSGPHRGERGYFHRDAAGRVSGLHVGGRFAPRTPDS